MVNVLTTRITALAQQERGQEKSAQNIEKLDSAPAPLGDERQAVQRNADKGLVGEKALVGHAAVKQEHEQERQGAETIQLGPKERLLA